MGVNNQDYIPLDQLTDDQMHAIDDMLKEFARAGTVETVTPNRTDRAVEIAKQVGFDTKEAGRLARHFDAATNVFNGLPEAQKTEIRKKLQDKYQL